MIPTMQFYRDNAAARSREGGNCSLFKGADTAFWFRTGQSRVWIPDVCIVRRRPQSGALGNDTFSSAESASHSLLCCVCVIADVWQKKETRYTYDPGGRLGLLTHYDKFVH